LGVLARAEELAHDGADGHHHAHEADEHGEVGRGTDGQRRQIHRGVAGHQQRVDGAEGQHRQLADQHRPGEVSDAPCAVGQ